MNNLYPLVHNKSPHRFIKQGDISVDAEFVMLTKTNSNIANNILLFIFIYYYFHIAALEFMCILVNFGLLCEMLPSNVRKAFEGSISPGDCGVSLRH